MKIVLSRESFEARHGELTNAAPSADWVLINEDGSFEGDPKGCTILYWGAGLFHDEARLDAVMECWSDPSLEWVQGPAAGIDNPAWSGLLQRGVRLTNASGIYAEPMAQYVSAWVLAWAQGLGGQMLRSQHHEWNPIEAHDLTSATMGIVGYGGIGKACARVAKAIGMRVVATRRTPGGEPDVDELLGPQQLHHLLSESDYVVLTTPLTDITAGLIGEAEFEAMGPGTVLINVSRGEIIDEDALTEALAHGVIRGATIDVTHVEPLPADSPLWDVPNLVITPHQSGDGPRAQERLDDLFVENLTLHERCEPLLNEVFDTEKADETRSVAASVEE